MTLHGWALAYNLPPHLNPHQPFTNRKTSPALFSPNHGNNPGYFLIILMAQMPEGLWQQLDSVPISCLQSNANGHKLLLRQPRHFASLTYSSLSIFFQIQTQRTLTHHAHVLPINFFFKLFQRRNKLSNYAVCVSEWKMSAELSFSDEEGNEEGTWKHE